MGKRAGEDTPKRPKRSERTASENSKASRRAETVDEDVEAEVVALFADPKTRPTGKKIEIPRGGINTSKYPDKPDSRSRTVKVVVGKRWSQIITEVKEGMYTWKEFAENLSPEELARGQLKAANGSFEGRPPTLVPRAFHDACIKEIQRRFNEKMQGRLLEATDELIDLSRAGGGLEPKDRAKVLSYLIERVMGPVPKTVTIAAEAPWEATVAGIFRPAVDHDPAAPSQTPPKRDRYAKRRRDIDPSEDVDV